MINGYVDKTPTELMPLTVDFADEIPSGDSIEAIDDGVATGATAVDSEGTDATDDIIADVSVSGTKLVVVLQAGADGMDYIITVSAEMASADTVFQKLYEMRVRAARRTF